MANKRKATDAVINVNVAPANRAPSQSRHTFIPNAAYKREMNKGKKRSNYIPGRKAHPDDKFGLQYVPRDPGTAMRYGTTWKDASVAQRLARTTAGYYGRGLYGRGGFWGDLWGGVKKGISKFAPMARSGAFGGYGKMAGDIAGITGMGLYGRGAYSGRTGGSANNLIDGGDPSMGIIGAGDETEAIEISHCEFVQDVYGAPSGVFYNESLQLNPGLQENFPWLSQLAQNYEEYEFIQLLYHFKSTVDVSATNTANGSTGTIILATQYNPGIPAFQNKETMMQYHGAQSGRVTEPLVHGVECDPEKNAGSERKYTRTKPVVVSQDIKTYDHGTFQIAQTNIPAAFANQQIGELWVTYRVRLFKPKLSSALLLGANECRYTSVSGSETPILWTGAQPMLAMQQNSIPLLITQVNHGFVLTFPDFQTGVFEIQVFIEGASMSVSSAATTFAGNVTPFVDTYGVSPAGDAPSSGSIIGGTAGYFIFQRVSVQPVIGGVDNTVSISLAFGGGSVSQSSIVVRQVNGSLGQNPLNPAPLYVNNLGVVTAP
jgi:hypothetical protein